MPSDVIRATGYRRQPGFIAAEYLGLFAAQGLEIDYEVTTHAPTHNAGMAVGRWNLTLSSADTMIARVTRDGTDYVLFMNAERGVDVKLVAADSIDSVGELRGKRLAGDPGDSNYDLHRRKMMRDHGLRDDDYEVEIVGATPQRYEALVAGKVVAAMLTPPFWQRAVERGFRVLDDAARHVPSYPVSSGWTLRPWAEANRDLLTRFIRAHAQGSDWVLDAANRERALDLLAEEAELEADEAERTLERVIPHAAIDPAGLASVVELRAEMGLYDPPYDPVERFYDASYWAEATGLPAPYPYGVPKIGTSGSSKG